MPTFFTVTLTVAGLRRVELLDWPGTICRMPSNLGSDKIRLEYAPRTIYLTTRRRLGWLNRAGTLVISADHGWTKGVVIQPRNGRIHSDGGEPTGLRHVDYHLVEVATRTPGLFLYLPRSCSYEISPTTKNRA